MPKRLPRKLYAGAGSGTAGPPGPPGATGATGAAGAPGATGAAGPTGSAGPGGAPGVPGDPGEPGDPGPPGTAGAPGSAGATGATGAQGQPGPPGVGQDGEPGDAGPPGPQGTAGATGAPGSTGATGPQGSTGPPGWSGDDGTDGQPGPPGQQGGPGVDGVPGATGAQGNPGPPGIGSDGEDGDIGPPGVPGQQGADGSAGAQGATGSTGPPGMWGEDGEDGGPGPPGRQGTDGVIGVDGAAGPPGPPGMDGEDGDYLGLPTPVHFARDLEYTPGLAIRADDIRITTSLFKKRQMQMLARFGPVGSLATIDSVGMKIAAMSGNGKSQIIPGTTYCVIRFLADGAVSGTGTYRQYLELPAGLAGGGLLRTGFDATCIFLIQTGVIHTAIRMWLGLTTADLNAVASPTAAHVCAFRYDTSVDVATTNWRAVSSDGIGGVQTTDTGVNAAVNATGFRMIIQTSVTTITFYINDVLVATHSTFVPANVDLGHTVCCKTLDATNKRIEWGRSAYLHSEFSL